MPAADAPLLHATKEKGVLNERIARASAFATRAQPPKPASLSDAGFATPCGGAGIGFSLLVCSSRGFYLLSGKWRMG